MCSATYSYDARSLLVTADGPPEANPGPMTNILNITRDTRRRITRLQHNAQITYRYYDNWNLIAEYAPSGTLLKEHIHGPRIDEILCAKSGANAKRRIVGKLVAYLLA
jgi:hypothetical protein